MIAVVIFYEYKRGSVSIFLWAMVEVMVGLAHLMNVMFGNFNYPPDVYEKAALFGITFILLYLLVRRIKIFPVQVNVLEGIRNKIWAGELDRDCDRKILQSTMKILMLCSILGILGFCIVTFGSLKSTTWAGFLYTGVSVYSFQSIWGLIYLISGMLILLPGGIMVTQLQQRKYIAFIIWFGIMTLPTIVLRNRAGILPLFVAVILFLYIKYDKVTLKLCAKYGFLAAAAIITLYTLRAYRAYGTIDAFLTNFNLKFFVGQIVNSLKNSDGELGLINAFYYFIDGKGQFPGFNTLATYRRILLMALPTRFSFGLKPSDFAIAMGSAYINDYTNTRYSMHPTLFGDCYANGNYMGVLLAVFWAVFVDIIDHLCNRKNVSCSIYFAAIWSYSYLLVGRGSVYNGVVTGVRLTIGFFIIYWVCSRIYVNKPRFKIRKVVVKWRK